MATLLFAELMDGASINATNVQLKWSASTPPPSGWSLCSADNVVTVPSAGPNGETVIDADDPSSYQEAGIWFDMPTSYMVWSGGTSGFYVGQSGINSNPSRFLVPTGYIEVDYYINSAAIADVSFGPVVWLADYNGDPGAMTFSWDNIGALEWELKFQDWNLGGPTYTTPIVQSTFENNWTRFRIEWQNTNGVSHDGFVKVTAVPYVGTTPHEASAVVLFNITGIDPYFGDKVGNADSGLITAAWLGYYGLMGPVTNFRLYSGLFELPEPEPIPPPPLVGTTLTRCDPPAPGTVAAPVGALPPWSSACDGGGVVDSVADLTDGEYWG